MMTPNTQQPDSDSENDLDYVPLKDDEESSSSSESEQPESKRARQEVQTLNPEEEEARKKDLWEKFQSSVNEARAAEPVPNKMVKICKQYRFAGEEVTEVVEVLEDSADATRWPLWHPPLPEAETPKTPAPPPSPEPAGAANIATPPASLPPAKRQGPRKPKTKLPELPGRSSSTHATKLTTLNKSVMDWKAHLQSSGSTELQEELEANRRGGGYLEKVEFLQRVDERKEAMLEAAKSKRKRG